MSITTIPAHDEYDSHETSHNPTDSAAEAVKNASNLVEFEPLIDQGPTKPLRLTWKERLRLIAQAVGFKTTLILMFLTLAALTFVVAEVTAVEP